MNGQQRVTLRDKDNNTNVARVTPEGAISTSITSVNPVDGKEYTVSVDTVGSMHVGLFDDKGNQADVFENSLATGDLIHKLTHDGECFFIANRISNFAIGGTIVYGIRVGNDSGETDSGLHMRLDSNVEGGVLVEVLVTDDFTGGTLVTPRNLNGNCDAMINPTGTLKKEMVSTFSITPSGIGTAVEWDSYEIGGAGTNQSRSQATSQSLEKIYPAGKNLILRFTSISNNTRLSYKLIMYEHEIQARE